MEAEAEETEGNVKPEVLAGFGEREKGREPSNEKNASRKGKGKESLLEAPEGARPANILISGQ